MYHKLNVLTLGIVAGCLLIGCQTSDRNETMDPPTTNRDPVEATNEALDQQRHLKESGVYNSPRPAPRPSTPYPGNR